jgi:hypothetical protein
MRPRGAGRSCAAALALALAAVPAAAEPPLRVRAAVTPPAAQLGARVTYRGTVVLHGGTGPASIRWARPDSSEDLLWGELRPRYAQGAASALYDTAHVEANLQLFDTGVVTVPGLRFEVQEGSRWVAYRLPLVEMAIVPTVAAADSNPRLRPLRGPLAAPWWERVPWTIVLGALAILAITFLLWRRLRRRRPAAAPATVPRLAHEDPAAEALRELAALRRLQLPEAGRYADHAFALTRILRRFLERTRSTPRPGHTTPELIADLREAGLGEAEVTRIAGLLGYWDRLKFARAGSAPGEARDAEDAVETLVRAGAPAARGEAA